MINLKTDIQFIKGVGPARAGEFRKAGINSVEDILYRIPFRYEDRSAFSAISKLRAGDKLSVSGKIIDSNLKKTRKRGFTIFEALIDDGTASIKVVWINQPYLKKVLTKSTEIIIFGEVQISRYGRPCLQLENPEYEILNKEEDSVHTGGIVPVYRNIPGIGQKALRKIIYNLIGDFSEEEAEFLPSHSVRQLGLIDRSEALKKIHFPDDSYDIDELNNRTSKAHRRLIFEEFFLLQAGLLMKKSGLSGKKKGISFKTTSEIGKKLREILPFSLTGAQRKVFKEIVADMTAEKPMNRLLQGDVGSGKTIVALLAMLLAVENGYQATLMAPTEILAEQHLFNIRKVLEKTDYTIALVKGGQKKSEREIIEVSIEGGRTDIIIGTHALIQKKIKFKKLGLTVIDEQHRFGVIQRAEVVKKGISSDVLVMTATPIPRTLALTVYGDLDLSVIDELPPGRMPVITRVVKENKRKEVYAFMKKNLHKGGQCFVVYPLIEESDKLDLKAATEMFKTLETEFGDFRLGLIHGKMKSPEKEEVMKCFKEGKLDLLVSTTVIEVGIDIPNSNIMIIENAERFGLAQLHQLRGRVGRGKRKSYCILMGSYKLSAEARARLSVMEKTDDGFLIAEKDLEIRGPGDFFGTKQSGLPELRIGNIVKDRALMEQARKEATSFLQAMEKDKNSGNNQTIRKINKMWKDKFSLIEVG